MRGSRRAHAWLVSIALLAPLAATVARDARGDEARAPLAAPDAHPATAPPRHALELGVSGLYERMTTSAGNASGVISSHRGGNALAVSIAYRSPYFLTPFLDIAYYPLYESTRRADLGSAGGTALAVGNLSALGFMAGPALDLFRFRLRAGVGTYATMVRSNVHSRVLDQTIHTLESDMGYLLALDGYVIKTERWRIGLELRAAFVVEADVTTVGIGLTIAGDALRF